jgi:hypothetical protein
MVPGEWEEQDSRCAARNCAAGEKGLQMTTVTRNRAAGNALEPEAAVRLINCSACVAASTPANAPRPR